MGGTHIESEEILRSRDNLPVRTGRHASAARAGFEWIAGNNISSVCSA